MDFIKRLQAKPVHVRERIAYGTAAGVAGIVAIVWFTTSLTTTGMLAPELSSAAYFAINHATTTIANNSLPGSLGAAANAAINTKNNQTPRLQIVDVSHSSTLVASSTPARTVIPF